MLVVGGVRGVAVGLRRGRRRRGKARQAEGDGHGPEVPVTRLTVIRPDDLRGAEAAEAWLRRTAGDEAACDELLTEALGIVNRALHAHRVATQDPHGGGVSLTQAMVIRIGYGTGDELADGRWTDAVEVPTPPWPRGRVEALRPQERLAATLGRRETQDACETLLLRARADLDGERVREAALQLRVGLEALLAEIGADAPASATAGALGEEQAAAQSADLEALGERRAMTGGAANEALAGELSPSRAEELAETLRLCERVLRRRRVLAR